MQAKSVILILAVALTGMAIAIVYSLDQYNNIIDSKEKISLNGANSSEPITKSKTLGQPGSYSIENAIPLCVITFDDGYSSQYGAYTYMASKGIRGTIYVITDLIGHRGSLTYLTLEQLHEIYNAGWDIGSHTDSHPDMTNLTEQQSEEHIEKAYDYLILYGFTRSAHHFAYPFGAYNDKAITALQAQGVLTARTVDGGYETLPYNMFRLKAQGGNNVTLTRSYIDSAMASGKTVFLIFHVLTEGTPQNNDEYKLSDFHDIIDYIVKKKLKCMTISEWYNYAQNMSRR